MPKLHEDPSHVVSDVRGRHVLRFAPVDMIEDRARRDALDAADGADLVQRRVTRVAVAFAGLFVLLVIAHLLIGCTSTLGRATSAVNEGRDFLEVAHGAIDGTCVPLYNAAKTPADLAAADARCLPASAAYKAAVAAWVGSTAAVLSVRAGGDPAVLSAAERRFADAVATLAKAVP